MNTGEDNRLKGSALLQMLKHHRMEMNQLIPNQRRCSESLVASPTAAAALANEETKAGTEKHPTAVRRFADDTEHLWNRLYRELYVRTGHQGKTYGHDVVDPLLWNDTKHLLEGRSHDEAIGVLDEFFQRNGHKLIDDPLRRAVLQHDMWAVFDRLARSSPREHGHARHELRMRLASVIHRLAQQCRN